MSDKMDRNIKSGTRRRRRISSKNQFMIIL